MNINKRIEYIETLLEKRNGIFLGGPYNLIIHSVLNTIDLYVLLDYYLAIHSESEIRKSIESNITNVPSIPMIMNFFSMECFKD